MRVIDLLNEYGDAKFRDEWWPGNADPFIGQEKGEELRDLLDANPLREAIERIQRMRDTTTGTSVATFDRVLDVLQILAHGGTPEQGS